MVAMARILVVEDEGIVGLDIRQSLEGLGYADAGLATSGEEAIIMAQAMQPDLVLMDIRLGDGMDGIDAAMAMGDHLDAPVIYLTAYTDANGHYVFRARAGSYRLRHIPPTGFGILTNPDSTMITLGPGSI